MNPTVRRYRQISLHMWGDEKFRALSAPRPNAQTLWIWLISGEFTTNIPGLVEGGLLGIAEALRWPLNPTKRCLAEIEQLSMMIFDRNNRLIWLPKGVYHNEPASPNVARGWVTTLHKLPDCELRDRMVLDLKAFLEGKGEGFAQAFEEAFEEAFAPAGSRARDARARARSGSGPGTGPEAGPRLRRGPHPSGLKPKLVLTPEQIEAGIREIEEREAALIAAAETSEVLHEAG